MATARLSAKDLEWVNQACFEFSQLINPGDAVTFEVADGRASISATVTATLTPGSNHNNPPEQA